MAFFIPLKSLPNDWQQWHASVCDLLRIERARPLADQPLPRPWFLFPDQHELSENDAANLLATLRSYLQPSSRTSVAEIRDRLQRLDPDAGLPFLYAMRYVAFASGGKHYYWPPFRRMMFDNSLGYDDIAIGLGSTTAELWMRLFTETRGALYHPPQGPVNIKWPLAHAGLLPEHKKTLEAFAGALLAKGDDVFDETLTLETDEFVLRYDDWVCSAAHYANDAFSMIMRSKRPERPIMAELGLRWLHMDRTRLKTEAVTGSTVPSRGPLSRRRLHYRAATNEICIAFSLGRLKIGHEASLTWNGHTWPLHFRDLRQQGLRDFDDLFLPLDGPDWPTKAEFVLAHGGSTTLAMPTLDGRQGLVFDAESGSQTKRWQLGEHYVILVADELLARALEHDKLKDLFSDWWVMDAPRGRWPVHRLLQVRTHDPARWETLSAQELNELEEAAETLGLPSFEHHFRARIRLFGGDLPAHGSDRGHCFAVDGLPYVEVTERVLSPINVVLQRQQDNTEEFKAIDAQWLHPDQGRSRIIEIPSNSLTPGHYRICADKECVDFTLVDNQETPAVSAPSVLQIEATIIYDADDQPVAAPNRHALEEDGDDFALQVKAWPGADLQLQIASAASINLQTFPILTDGQGEWREQFLRLPIVWDALPEGDVTLTIGWRGLFTQTITAEDKTYCTLAEFNSITEPSPEGGRFVFTCWGRLKGAPQDVKLFGYLLPPLPWQRPPHLCELVIASSGKFSARTLVDWRPGWTVIGDPHLLEEGDALIIAVKALQGTPTAQPPVEIDLAQELGPHIAPWHTLADRIKNVSPPVALSVYLRLAAVLRCLPEVRDFLNAKPAWTSIDRWGEWPRISPLLQHASSVAVFRKRLPAGQVAQPILGVTVNLPPQPVESERLTFRFNDTNMPVGGQFIKVNHYGEERIVITPEATLRACGKCHVILPAAVFDDHERPYAEMPNCTESQPWFTQYTAGSSDASEYIAIGVLAYPDVQLMQIRAYLAEFLRLHHSPSDQYPGLLDQLKPLCPANQNPAEWLAGLIAALDALDNLRRRYRQNPCVSLADLDNLGTPLAGYETALAAVMGTLGLDRATGPAVAPTPKATPKTPPAPPPPLPESLPEPSPSLPVTTAPASPAPTARSEDNLPPEAAQPAPLVKKSQTPVVDVAKPPSQPAPKSAPTRYATDRVQIALASYDVRVLDHTVGALVRQLRSANIQVSGPILLPNRRDDDSMRQRRILLVPSDSKWEQALRSLHLPRSVEVKLSSGRQA